MYYCHGLILLSFPKKLNQISHLVFFLIFFIAHTHVLGTIIRRYEDTELRFFFVSRCCLTPVVKCTSIYIFVSFIAVQRCLSNTSGRPFWMSTGLNANYQAIYFCLFVCLTFSHPPNWQLPLKTLIIQSNTKSRVVGCFIYLFYFLFLAERTAVPAYFISQGSCLFWTCCTPTFTRQAVFFHHHRTGCRSTRFMLKLWTQNVRVRHFFLCYYHFGARTWWNVWKLQLFRTPCVHFGQVLFAECT